MKVFTETVTCDRGHEDPLRCECARRRLATLPTPPREFKVGPYIVIRKQPKRGTVA